MASKKKYQEFIFRVHFKNDYMEAEVRFYIEANDVVSAYKRAEKLEEKFRETNPTFKASSSTCIQLI